MEFFRLTGGRDRKTGACIIQQAIQTNMPLLDSDRQICLACVGFERTLISHLPPLHAWSALNITQPGACAVINMADGQNIALTQTPDWETIILLLFFFFF